MRSTIDTFLKYLEANLPGIVVHAVRFDKNSSSSLLLKANAVNVQFVVSNFTPIISEQSVAIDVINDDELTALDVAQQVANLLLATTIIQKYDYSSGSPVAVAGSYIYWKPNIKFRTVAETFYFRFTADIKLSQHQ